MNYKLQQNSIQRLTDNAFIPADSSNRDYADYLAWCAAGNAPLPADVPNPNTAILTQLAALESNPAIPRTVREHMIATDQVLASIMATLNPATPAAQLLAANTGHQRIVAVDTQAHALRAQLK